MLRRTVVAAVALLTISACGSAADIESDADPGATPRQSADEGSGRSEGTSPPSSTPRSPSSPPTDTTEPEDPSPTQQPRSPKQLPNTVGAFARFQMPSRNIGCVIGANFVRCDIREFRYSPPSTPADCPGAYGQSLAVGREGIGLFVCAGDTVLGPRAPVLQYGTSTVVGDFGCTSRLSGVTCYQLLNRHGFVLSQDTPSLF